MIPLKKKHEYYQALLDKNVEYEGIFFVGVKTTGVFCRPTCPARKPKFTNCEFFATAKEALLASYRPCQRCRPLSHPQHASATVRKLVNAIEKNPEKRWQEKDLQALAVDSSTARRQFKRRFGMTFIEYARARRMGIAMKQIRQGESIINTQVDMGYESSSGFRDAFSRIMGDAPAKFNAVTLKASWLDTPLGPMLCITDDEGLYLLEFVDRRGLEREVERLRKRLKAAIIPGETLVTQQVNSELDDYFMGKFNGFNTPLHLIGSNFQQSVWKQLQKIPLGETRSYSEMAQLMGQPKAFRAVARANGTNQIAIVIPCHRVINANGKLAGYGGGLQRKQWLLEHEKS